MARAPEGRREVALAPVRLISDAGRSSCLGIKFAQRRLKLLLVGSRLEGTTVTAVRVRRWDRPPTLGRGYLRA